MSMFLCHTCDNLRDADDGCDEGPNNSLICQDCLDEMLRCDLCDKVFDEDVCAELIGDDGSLTCFECAELIGDDGSLTCFECAEDVRAQNEQAKDERQRISVGGHKDGGSAS